MNIHNIEIKFLLSLQQLFRLPLINQVSNSLPKFPNRIAVALSGGVDSTCLFHLLLNYKKSYQPDLQISAITIDHNLRPESKYEAESLHQYISGELHKEWGDTVRHETIKIRSTINENQMERHARDLRHQLIAQTCQKLGVDRIFMGHHLDDQLETFLLRLSKNSTIFGLAGMQPVSKFPVNLPNLDLKIIRPMLEFRKQDIYDYCKSNGLFWFEDISNNDISLTPRNLYRHYLRVHIDKNNISGLNKDEITKTFLRTVEYTTHVQDRVKQLRSTLFTIGLASYDNQSLSLKLNLPGHIFHEYTPLEIDRFIYETVYKVSPSSNYHDTFTRFNSTAEISTRSSIDKNQGESFTSKLTRYPLGKSKFTLVLCNFLLEKYVNKQTGSVDCYLEVFKGKEFTRRPTPDLQFGTLSQPLVFCDWLFYDERLHVRVACTTGSEQYLNKKLYISSFRASDGIALKKNKMLKRFALKYNIPVIRDEYKKIVCFPTLENVPADYRPKLIVECKTKSCFF
ncbi:unnamed protein product [Ambrosiozyma monospora]|uniref:Unnamed protein product n=1 Tax=Ambrosiozyma monospora TaxID=43982 RepID=A0ACB5SYL1_AMBMO|nr:unnamed protein product [Ambrosiozyma monospora]